MKLGSLPYPDCVFISDVHLGVLNGKYDFQLESELAALIEHCTEQNICIFILGDLFDYWMEYPDHDFKPALGEGLLSLFKTYNETVFPIPYITGNHDHWTYGYLRQQGFRISQDYIEVEIDGQNTLLCHGDGFLNGDFGLKSPLLHRVLKSSGFIKWYQRLLPPGSGLALMKNFSAWNQRFPDHDPEPLNRWAENCLRNYDFNVIICGHDHIPRSETLSYGCYLNTGAYYLQKTLVLHKNSEFKLVTWKSEEFEFKPAPDQN